MSCDLITTTTVTTTTAAISNACLHYRTMDVVFVVASDAIIGAANWVLIKQFVSDVVGFFDIGSSNTRFVTLYHMMFR